MRTTHRRIVVDDSALARRIGSRLREARKAAGLTQQQLAEGRYTKAYVSALENGLSKPSMASLSFFAERLGMPVGRFVDGGPTAWSRLEADLALASGQWQQAADTYRGLLDADPTPPQRAELLLGLAEALARLDRGPAAAAAAGEAARLFTELARPADAALATYWLSCAEHEQGNTVEARTLLRGILDKVRAGLRVQPDYEIRLLMALSSNESRDGNHAAALAYLEEIRVADRLDDRRRAAYLYDLAYSYRETGDFEGAIRAGIGCLALFQAAEAELESGALENDLALSYLALGNGEKAGELATCARARFERLDDGRWLAHVVDTQARIALAGGAADDGIRLAREALELAERSSNEKAAVSASLTLARAEIALGRNADALADYERAADLARHGTSTARLREVLAEWADMLARAGELERALDIMREALGSSPTA